MNEAEYASIKKTYDKRALQLQLDTEKKVAVEINSQRLETKLIDAEQAAYILQDVGKETQQNLEFHISNIVTSALHAVDSEWPEFIVRFEVKGRAAGAQTECLLLFKEGDNEYKPELGSGGGPLDVASFALRIARWSLKKNRPCFLLDEPFKFVDPTHQHKTSEMVKMLSEELIIQIIMVSHAEDIEDFADKIVHMEKVSGESIIS